VILVFPFESIVIDSAVLKQIFTQMSKSDGCLKLQYVSNLERMVGQVRLELTTSRLSVVRSSQLSYKPGLISIVGGGKETRTPDILLAKQALYQLSYAPSQKGKREDKN
jgi:hypothetical protein